MTSQTLFQGIKVWDKYSEPRGTQKMTLLWALLETTIKGQTPLNQEVTVETTAKERPVIMSIECI